MADALWKIGDTSGCLDHITTAHLLNYYHEEILKRLKEYLFLSGNEWQEWSFNPVYSLSKKEHVVKVAFDMSNSNMEYMPYILVKALWKYEPGYAGKMLGAKKDPSGLKTTEEREAIGAYLSDLDNSEIIFDVVMERYINEFIYYEIWLKKYPEALYLLPKEFLVRTKEYLSKFH